MGSQLNRCLREEIEVKLLLEKKIKITCRNLDIALNEDGMKITNTDERNNIITVTGTPPEHGYNADNVLAVVKQHDSKAQILSQTALK